MTVPDNVTIIGAGPYGLSLAAHLRACGASFRIIGRPMENWLEKMPKGMLLKSAGFASTLYDPDRSFTLQRFCEDHGEPYCDLDYPIPLETFCSYGIAFQKRFAPDLEDEKLTALQRCPEGFELRTEGGKSFKSRRVILGVGIDYFRHVPESLAHLPAKLLSHSAEHHDLAKFAGRKVAVIGAGASATDMAILLHEAKAEVSLIARTQKITFGGPWGGTSPTLWRRIRAPISPIGPGWRSALYSKAPWLFRYLPERMRARIIKSHLGPAGAWFMQKRAEPVPFLLGCRLGQARESGGRVQLELVAMDGGRQQVTVDHVIAATGYRIDVRRLPFLGRDILDQLRLVEYSPILSPNFESSVPGLYFVGPIAATCFGPVMRFAAGAHFTARRVSEHLARPITPPHQSATGKLDSASCTRSSG